MFRPISRVAIHGSFIIKNFGVADFRAALNGGGGRSRKGGMKGRGEREGEVPRGPDGDA